MPCVREFPACTSPLPFALSAALRHAAACASGPLSPPEDPRPPPPLREAKVVKGGTKLLVLAKMRGHSWWPGLVSVSHREATSAVPVDFVSTNGHASISQSFLKPFTEADMISQLPSKAELCEAMEEARQLFAKTPRRRGRCQQRNNEELRGLCEGRRRKFKQHNSRARQLWTHATRPKTTRVGLEPKWLRT